jgi:DNA polymerase-3 subunit delta'
MRPETARELVSDAFRRGRMAHAYLLAGSPRGAAGELAVHILQMLACGQDEPPCGACERCRQVAGRAWCDNLWVAPRKKSRAISIEQMRRTEGSRMPPPYLLSWLGKTSFAGGWKAAVLEGADRLNEAAANALLKMLEEPPPWTLLLLLSDAPQALPATILSRCQRLDLDEPPPGLDEPWRSQVLAVLAGPPLSGPVAAMAAAQRLAAVLEAMKKRAGELVRAESHADEAQAEEEADEPVRVGSPAGEEEMEAWIGARYREMRTALLLTMQRWFRDLLALRAGADPAVAHCREHLATLQERARRLTLAQALANVESIEDLARQMERNLPEQALLEYWLDRLADGAA